VRDAAGTLLARVDIVLPVSDEMDCSTCHASGSAGAARPLAGWVDDPDPQRDFRRNILRLHDDHRATGGLFRAAAAAAGYDEAGLEATAANGTPVLCAACHASNALPGTGFEGVPPLTRSVHAFHGPVTDPVSGGTLDDADNRGACYRCHPGSRTRCLRGAMGRAVGDGGEPAMECQSCHGSMSTVGAAGRVGWLEQPACQSCHTGTATVNSGRIRFLSAFDDAGDWRIPADDTFATDPDTPAPGFDLYRFSTGHGGLQCEACHGSTHAVFPSSHPNDNVAAEQIQGHQGTLVECSACHGSSPSTGDGGPHGLHPVGQEWARDHDHELAKGGAEALGACRACHGADDRGSVLSRSQATRTITTEFGTKTFWRGFEIGCFTCHNGPSSDDPNPNRPPSVEDAAATAVPGATVTIPLTASDPDGQALTLRVVSPAAAGTAWIDGVSARYRAPAGFTGSDVFTFAARDGMTDSNLGTVTVTVAQSACTLECSATVPGSAPVAGTVRFVGQAAPAGCQETPTVGWDFGDGGFAEGLEVDHAYAASGRYAWSMTAAADGVSCVRSGSILVSASGEPTWSRTTVVARTPGVGGSSWRSDLVLVNPGEASADLILTFRSGAGPQEISVALPAGGSIGWDDVLMTLFGLDEEAAGSLEILSTEPITATVRTFNADPAGAFGQFFPSVAGADGLTDGVGGIVPHLKRDDGSRSNLGLVNLSDLQASVRVTVFGADGGQLGEPIVRTVPARGWVQINDVVGRTGDTSATLAWAAVDVTTPGASVWAYGSVISSDSGDPITVPVAVLH
ncbi:MAG TPA: Ig-like domain-containing protein, partial [Candidatus Sulfomarinibacteraceae bacterium]|nr:Ig-like domain-containing protein [Candidatus Sulfomarinibacteraceae bacterium]